MVDDKQFIICDYPLKRDNWKYLLLDSGSYLNYQELLPIEKNTDNSIVLIGWAWQTDPNKRSPRELIECGTTDLDSLITEENYWCGRYAVIINDKLLLDATGMLGIFYSKNTISSSLKLICEIEKIQYKYPKLYHGLQPDFIPGRGTNATGVFRVLPSQILDIKKREVISRKILTNGVSEFSSDSERINQLVKLFICSLRNMEREFHGQKLCLALTGGRDSRTNLSLLMKAGVPFSTFTFNYAGISDGDTNIPTQIAEKLSLNHHFISGNKFINRKRANDYKKHCSGMAVDHDLEFWSQGHYDQLKRIYGDNLVVLRSSIWECVIDYFNDHAPQGGVHRANVNSVFKAAEYDQLLSSSLQDYLSYIDGDHLNEEWSLANRLYLELREGCWLSSIEQSYDVMDGITSIQPANSRIFLSILLGFKEQERHSKEHQEQIINICCPELVDIPYDGKIATFNSLKMKIDRTMDLVLKGLWCSRNWGLAKTIRYLSNK